MCPHTSAMSELKAGTAVLHQRLEKRLRISERFGERARYIDHLERIAAFHVSAEEQWAAFLRPVLSDFPSRCKSALLLQDLAHLGGTVRGPAAVTRVDNSAAALGAFYVLEGSTLGGRHLSALVERTLGLDARSGASYLVSYGAAVPAMWETFGAEVNAYCRDAAAVAHAVTAARKTFAALEHWLCEAAA